MIKGKKFFNTVGAINPKKHYFLPHRLDWKQLEDYIDKEYYFVLHAPRQSGKTTAVIEFVHHLRQQAQYVALYLSIESARVAMNDVPRAVQIILEQFKNQISDAYPNEKKIIAYLDKATNEAPKESGVYNFLRFWAQESQQPLVLFFDEFDVLTGDSLIALLTQLRTGYTNRPERFPQSLCLIGVRDLRDYKIKTPLQEEYGALYSPFNISAESLTIPGFSLDEIQTLYGQHTLETGQPFTHEAIQYVFDQTQGQPWLVNALAYQACFRDIEDRSKPISKEVMERSREALIKRCDTHIDALIDRLQEPRVCAIMDAIISGSGEDQDYAQDDLQYVRDLGLIGQNNAHIANLIYQEIIPRALILSKQDTIRQELSWYQKPDGSLDMSKLISNFALFYRENAEVWLEKFAYKESGPHLLLLAFLQRIINGGGTIHREYALGRKRVDLLIIWKSQRFVIEIKIARGKDYLIKGLQQTTDYMDTAKATEGHLVIFDRNTEKSWGKKHYHRVEIFENKTIAVWGM